MFSWTAAFGPCSTCVTSLFPRILALEKLGAVFNQVSFPLQYTPRKFVIHPESNNLIVIETDHNAYTEATKAQRKQQMAEVMGQGTGTQFCCLEGISAAGNPACLPVPSCCCLHIFVPCVNAGAERSEDLPQSTHFIRIHCFPLLLSLHVIMAGIIYVGGQSCLCSTILCFFWD